jgi:hypothetical protein
MKFYTLHVNIRIFHFLHIKSKEITKISDPIIDVRIHPDLTKLAVVTSS